MYGQRIITGIPTRQYYNCRRAYAWLKDYINRGYTAYYKLSPESCRQKKIYKLTLKGNSLWAITPEYSVPIEGLPLIIRNAKNQIVDKYTWLSKPYRVRAHVSQECIQSKKSWIKYFLGTGELRCYPESSNTPFIITNINEDEGGIYATQGLMKVYLNVFYIYYTDQEGNVDCHTNW